MDTGAHKTLTPTRLFTRVDAAAQLSVSTQALDRLIKAGRLRPVRVGARVLVSDAEIARFITESEAAS